LLFFAQCTLAQPLVKRTCCLISYGVSW